MKYTSIYTALISSTLLMSCGETKKTDDTTTTEVSDTLTIINNVDDENFEYVVEDFADIQVLRYQIHGFNQLSLTQQKLVYYLYQAGLAGRDIIWDQNYRHNLAIRSALENVYQNYSGDKSTDDWSNFEVYTKRVWFSNGIHHHYSMDKIMPAFSKEYFETLLSETSTQLAPEIVEVMFNDKDMKRVSLDANGDLVLNSATNFYQEDLTQKEVEDFYAEKIDKSDETPIEYGLNSKLIKDENGEVKEEVWKVGGMYNDAIVEVVK